MKNKMETIGALLTWAAMGLIGVWMSYGLALLNEPQSLWVWRDLLGVL